MARLSFGVVPQPTDSRLSETNHGLPLITSQSKMTTVLIRRNAPTDSCHNLTALMPRCTKTSFIINPHYICAHRNSHNLHNADFIGNSSVMADVHLLVVLHRLRNYAETMGLKVLPPHEAKLLDVSAADASIWLNEQSCQKVVK